MAEILEESNEINEVLGQSYGIGDDMDEDELLGELDMLGEMDLGDASYMDNISAPPVPTGPIGDVGPPQGQPQGLDEYGLPLAPMAS